MAQATSLTRPDNKAGTARILYQTWPPVGNLRTDALEEERHAEREIRIPHAHGEGDAIDEVKAAARVERRPEDGPVAGPDGEPGLAEDRPVGREPEVPLHD